MKVTARPNSSDHAQAGSTPIRLTSPSAETPDWTRTQPLRGTAMARPTTALPPCPKPVHRVSSEVCSPSRAAMIPTPMETISRMTAPRVNAQKAVQNPMPKPSVDPSRNWLRADTWPKRWTATDHHE